MSKSPRLGIAAAETFSVCRMINVDEGSPKQHSSLSVIQNDLSRRTLHVGTHVMDGAIEYIIRQGCDFGTPRFMDVVEFYSGIMEGSREKMNLICRENLPKEEALEFMTYEILEHSLGRPSEVRRGMVDLMTKCFGE